MAKKSRFITLPIKFKVSSNKDGVFLVPPVEFQRLVLGSKPRRRSK